MYKLENKREQERTREKNRENTLYPFSPAGFLRNYNYIHIQHLIN